MNSTCPSCGEGVKPHWVSCPTCLHPLDNLFATSGTPAAPLQQVERDVRLDLLWSGIAMVSLAGVGLIGLVMNLFHGRRSLASDQYLIGLGAIIFASMVGGGLIGGSRTGRRQSLPAASNSPAPVFAYPVSQDTQRGNAVAKGVLMGLLGSVGTILAVFGVIALMILCLFIFLFVTCLQMIHK